MNASPGGRGPLTVGELVAAALAEDLGEGDVTSRRTVPAAAVGTVVVLARRAGVIAGIGPFRETFRQVDAGVEVACTVEDGGTVDAGGTVARLEGRLRSLFAAERTALNFLGRLSGVATLTSRYVAAVEGLECRITDTRKTTPGWRRLEKAATAAGGAVNHRMGLWDMVLIKENHVRAAGGVGEAVSAARASAGEAGLEVAVEVRDLSELEEALGAGPDRILLDNMAPHALRRAVQRTEEEPLPRPLLEASGGVTLETVRAVAETGVDLVSVGALTHSAPNLDLTLLVEEA